MNYRGLVLTMTPSADLPTLDYYCTAHYAGHIEVVPVYPDNEHIDMPPIPVTGASAAIIKSTRKPERHEIEKAVSRFASVERALKTAEKANMNVLAAVRLNLDRLRSLTAAENFGVQWENAEAGKLMGNDIFAALYGGEPCGDGVMSDSPNFVGKIVFIEIPLDADDWGHSGEFIIVQQSDDSLYGVKTTCALSGIEVVRIPFDDGMRILDAYEDDGFIATFIERLEDMDTDDYSALECDAAETAAHQLRRLLGQEAELDTAPHVLDETAALDRFFNSHGSKTGRVACINECCGVGV